jgi:riboflavin kinase/FMN adenylyltransferase
LLDAIAWTILPGALETTRRAGTAVVPGNHDGVHAGHRALLAEARARADAASLDVVALTFDPHPLALLAPERAPEPLTTIERRIELLRAAGADQVVITRFDANYASQSAEEWVERVLLEQLGARWVVVGPDFQFGAGRTGTVALLAEHGAPRGLRVAVVPPVVGASGRVSSTRIREALREGDVATATAMLERVHEIEGRVVAGDRRGRTIGFPTANLAPDPVLAPADGVYAVVARVLDDPGPGPLLRGVANLGTRPTFDAGRSIEVHLFDFSGDLYGRRLRVGFVARLRSEQKFDSLEALRARIAEDARTARALLSSEDSTWRAI